MSKVLTLCYPTYNRGWCMKQQIDRLSGLSQCLFDKIEILISDNCSTDDTQNIVENAIAQGFQCRYIRNKENLGMDGNFVNCFRNASGKYVWLLGDDDIIIPDALRYIINVLDTDIEYGLVHIQSEQTQIKNPETIVYTDKNKFAKSISFAFSFISANIVNAKYVSKVPFEKYSGSLFSQIPLYLMAMGKENKNMIFYFHTFELAKDAEHNGGYNFFKVFVKNYLDIINETVDVGYLSKSTFKFMKKDIMMRFIYGYMKKLLLSKYTKNNYAVGSAWTILFQYYGCELYFYCCVLRGWLSCLIQRSK